MENQGEEALGASAGILESLQTFNRENQQVAEVVTEITWQVGTWPKVHTE